MLTAQDLYDYREESGAISGIELHELFQFLTDGEPSPAGRTPISLAKLIDAQSEFAGDIAEFCAAFA